MALQKISVRVSGAVEHGFAQARNSGYPTANLKLTQPLDIPEGIYCARTLLESEHSPVPSIVFYGIPYALPDVVEPRFEVHLLEKGDNLYGREIAVELVAFVRENRRFDDIKSLERAIEGDIVIVRNYFGIL